VGDVDTKKILNHTVVFEQKFSANHLQRLVIVSLSLAKTTRQSSGQRSIRQSSWIKRHGLKSRGPF
jgi:hypothetical protein